MTRLNVRQHRLLLAEIMIERERANNLQERCTKTEALMRKHVKQSAKDCDDCLLSTFRAEACALLDEIKRAEEQANA